MKAFGIGLSKTGTNSLNKALSNLGFRARHYPPPSGVLGEAERWDALTDTPVVPYYKELERRYPAARFVLTVREMESWLASCKRHWGRYPATRQRGVAIRNRINIFGIANFDEEIFRRVYQVHYDDVMWYFENKQEKLLVMNIVDGDGYDKLCPFLDKPVLDKPFPHRNKAS